MSNASPGRRGLLLVLSSPSGAGKTTLAKRVLAADANIGISVSVTTRTPRPGEKEGVDYYFLDEAPFLQDFLQRASGAVDAAAGRDADNDLDRLGRFPRARLRDCERGGAR